MAGDSGTHTFLATLVTVGNQSFTATDTSNSSITGTGGTNIASPPTVVQFSASNYNVGEAAGSVTITVTRTGSMLDLWGQDGRA